MRSLGDLERWIEDWSLDVAVALGAVAPQQLLCAGEVNGQLQLGDPGQQGRPGKMACKPGQVGTQVQQQLHAIGGGLTCQQGGQQ